MNIFYRNTKIIATIDWVNQGNGYTYFIWEKNNYRAYSGNEDYLYKNGDKVEITLDCELRTYDDFENHLIPSIIRIEKLRI